MKKFLSGILSMVLLISCLTISAFAAEAPKMEHTKVVGGVTVSNFVSMEEVDSRDFNNMPIHIYRVKIGPHACIRSEVNNTNFIWWKTDVFNGIESEEAIYTDKAYYSPIDGLYISLDDARITPYPTTKGSNGLWSKGLTWEFGDYRLNEKNGFAIKVIESSQSYYYWFEILEYPVYSDSNVVVDNTPPAEKATAIPTSSPVYVNGKIVKFDAYNINNNNYFKLRDIAQVLRGTEKQFEVVWSNKVAVADAFGNPVIGGIVITPGKPYTTVGGELKAGDGKSKACNLNKSPVFLNGNLKNMTAYNINGNNYFKLRDIGMALNFDVSWDSNLKGVVIDTTKGYDANT